MFGAVFGKTKKGATETKSPVEEILHAFTKSSKEMHSFLGFPGVLLLLAVLPMALVAIPGYQLDSVHAVILASVALGGSVATYSTQRYSDIKRAEAQSEVLREYARLFLEKYLEGREKIGAEEIEWATNQILKPLLGEHREPPSQNH